MRWWPFALRSTVDHLRLRLVAEHERYVEVHNALAVVQVSLRQHKLLLAGRYETVRTLTK